MRRRRVSNLRDWMDLYEVALLSASERASASPSATFRALFVQLSRQCTSREAATIHHLRLASRCTRAVQIPKGKLFAGSFWYLNRLQKVEETGFKSCEWLPAYLDFPGEKLQHLYFCLTYCFTNCKSRPENKLNSDILLKDIRYYLQSNYFRKLSNSINIYAP